MIPWGSILEAIELQQAQDQVFISPSLLLVRIVEAGLVLLVTYIVARYIIGYIPRIIPMVGQARFIHSFIAIIRYLIYAIGSLIALAIIAPEPGVFSALVLILGIGVIIAFSDTLRNWGSEVYVRSFTSLKIGDHVEIMGREGTVIHMDSRGIIIETPMREKIYVPNTYLASSPIINKTSPYGTQYRIKIQIPMTQDNAETIEMIRKELEGIRPELVEEPVIHRRGVQGDYSVYEVVVTLLNVRKINYLLELVREAIEKKWQGSRVYI